MAFDVVHAFTGADGTNPYASLIQGTDGNFYGTTSSGGNFNFGTVFQMTPSGAVTVLHAFTGGTDGGSPYASLIQATDGNFYGTASAGGMGAGTVFQITPSGAFTVLHAFTGADGAAPYAALIQGADGNFYGTTANGGVTHLCPLDCCPFIGGQGDCNDTGLQDDSRWPDER